MTNAERVRRFHERRWREIDEMPPIPCACGCGTQIPPYTKHLQPRRYAHGHNSKVRGSGCEATQFKPDQRRGRLNHKWKGGRKLGHSGYVSVLVGKGHPMAKAGTGYALEHRFVMSEAIGRPLRTNEEVHHINGDRGDNRLENLQLRQKGHGSGGAYRCCECGSHNVEPIPLEEG